MLTRSEKLEAFHEAAGFEFSILTTESLFADWEVYPVIVGNKVAGAYVVRGCEIHVAVKPEFDGKWFLKWAFGVLSDIIKEHGRVETSVMNENKRGHRFVQRIGFVLVGQDEHRSFYEMREAS